MTKALSGAEARGEAATNNRPYKQDFAFDVFGNVTSRTGKHWSRSLQAFGGTYDNNRRDGWQYDADGRNTVSNSVTSTFDAAGRLIQTSGPQRRNNPPLVLTQGFDGDGQQIKKTEYGQEIYSLRSTALGGALVTEIFGTGPVQLFGQKQRGRVYVNGTELAHQSPITGEASYVPVDPSGVVNLSVTAGHLDPIGNDVGDEDPYLPETDPGFSYPHMGDINDQGGGCVSINGTPLNCSRPYGKGRLRRVADLFLPSLSRFRPRFDPRTPGTFPGSQTTSGSIFRDVVSGSALGFLYPKMNSMWLQPFIPWGSLYANPDNSGRAPLDEKSQNEYDDLQNHLLGLLEKDSDCARYLENVLHVSPADIANTVRAQRPFDGTRSTLSLRNAGLVNPRSRNREGRRVSSRESVRSFFSRTYSVAAQAGYPRAGTGATINDVYYHPGWFDSTTILHEALHTHLDKDDAQLGKRADVVALGHAGCGPSGRAYP